MSTLEEIEYTRVLYKKTVETDLYLHVYRPPVVKNDILPCVVFFFGGGWVNGTPDHFKNQANYLAMKGYVAICAEYRIFSKHNTTPFECAMDGKSAIRFVRSNASTFGISPDRIAAAGGSAGGHVAATTAFIPEICQETDDLTVSCVPNALVLFNPVLDTTEDGYGQDRLGERMMELSVVHHVKDTVSAPPTLVMHGKSDTIVPYANAEHFKEEMDAKGFECKLLSYADQGHGFFNLKDDNPRNPYYYETRDEMFNFLSGRL